MKGAAVTPAAVISACHFANLAESLAKSAIPNPSAPNARAIEVPMPGPTPATMTTGFISIRLRARDIVIFEV